MHKNNCVTEWCELDDDVYKGARARLGASVAGTHGDPLWSIVEAVNEEVIAWIVTGNYHSSDEKLIHQFLI